MEPSSSTVPAGGASTPSSTAHPASGPRTETTAEGIPQDVRRGAHERKPAAKDFSRGAGRGGRGGRSGKRRDLGRADWAKTKVDKRKRNDDEQAAKRRRLDEGNAELPIYATKFSEEDLAAEERRPKKKVAVLIGYAGTGYHGMQLTHDKKTIEGDLFKAFVAAGAISKANADDPKKSSFVRCARTDKGVHAAGNIISLKLIIEDPDIVKKINDNLTPQIRIWGFERTNNSFSSYQAVDSRIYEYLIPTHSFLPPHPSSFLGRKLEEWAEKKGDVEAYKKRQEEVLGFWETVDEQIIKPILAEYDQDVRDILEKSLWLKGGDLDADTADGKDLTDVEPDVDSKPPRNTPEAVEPEADTAVSGDQAKEVDQVEATERVTGPQADASNNPGTDNTTQAQPKLSRSAILTEATKRLRQAYIDAKRSYRIPASRLVRIQEALNHYVGTKNYHNFTIQKTFTDPSAKRVIKSFVVNQKPILINGTEWLSMKVHGQSFMMHQIRKMVAMVALVVRCGCDPHRIYEALGPANISIPKAPSLGLLLERPVFDSYNKRAKGDLGKEPIDFDKFKAEMDRFKQEQIYERMYRDEEKENVFGNFFNHVDAFPNETFLFVTSGGIEATKTRVKAEEAEGSKAEHALVAADVGGGGGVDDGDDGDSDADDVVKDNHGDEG
ncbi:tRNA pseudouridine38-40 synthase [Capronia epimyces CBS 606.96]|uniref:tRNA pseudouridine synthase 1 n=1 Tax=Capronia epimyces CBS 606.96 TaxID=1182542 RepID=W9YIZ2_9EURO|nr:tRNA pseudouridine38-40 synthase [Capronia epimyces CBS 606.96]EXJ89226.1 tRNA pseudouridine38-40 synthase [Capronia epimyces CBS 606.96]